MYLYFERLFLYKNQVVVELYCFSSHQFKYIYSLLMLSYIWICICWCHYYYNFYYYYIYFDHTFLYKKQIVVVDLYCFLSHQFNCVYSLLTLSYICICQCPYYYSFHIETHITFLCTLSYIFDVLFEIRILWNVSRPITFLKECNPIRKTI